MTDEALRAAVREYFQIVTAGDQVDRYMALYAPDGTLEDPVGSPPASGEAIRQQASMVGVLFEHLEITPGLMFVGGQEVAAYWTGRGTTRKGDKFEYEGIGIFHFDDQGKLRSVREFYDPAILIPLFSGLATAAAT